MIFENKLNAMMRARLARRRAVFAEEGLADPNLSYLAANTWSRLSTKMAERCVRALLLGQVDHATRLARRSRAAAERAEEAQDRGLREEREVRAAAKGYQ